MRPEPAANGEVRMSAIDDKDLKIGAGFLVFSQGFQAVFAFAVNLVLVRYIFPDEFGRFAIILAGASVVYAVLSPRINILIIRKSEADLNEATRDIYFSALTFETLIATLVIILWLAVTGSLGLWEPVLILAIGMRHWTGINKAFFEREMPYRRLAVIEAGADMAGHLAALGLVLLGAGWVVLFVRELIISVLGLFGLWKIGGLTLRRIKPISLSDVRMLFRETRGGWLDGVLEGSFQRLTILLAGFIGGEATAGYFFQAHRLAIVPHQLLSPIINRILAVWFGRTEDRWQRRDGRNRMLRFLVAPLLFAGILTVLFADPVVPWLFGETWARVADIVVALSGMIVFFSLFETLKSYCLTARPARKILVGRVVQYVGLLVPVAAWFAGWMPADISLAVGLSAAYLLAFIVVLGLLHKDEGTWEKAGGETRS